MSQRKPVSLYKMKDKMDPSGECSFINKGLQKQMRQPGSEQTQTHPVSNFEQQKYFFQRQQRRNFETNSFQQQLKADKFNEKNKTQEYWKTMSNLNKANPMMDAQKKKIHNTPLPNISFEYQNLYFNENKSETESENDNNDSLYADDKDEIETFGESEYDGNDDMRASIRTLHRGLKNITRNYVRMLDSQVDNAMSKILISERKKSSVAKNCQKQDKRSVNPTSTVEVYTKMESMRKECYKKIQASLERLQHIDNVTDELFHNHVENKMKEK
ncbi:CLUMA_CG014153, isoform A [Clunio marinus]|uniref:CLUMA_CG014153, isoform A n=1 Tax=Clunio marinus TaxID=568069 RepID=A0A1J1IKY6_9DIPT|nr:CLUMA_CG014153, isoform A [Clunio marinus]